jgi:hypothetical protein
VIPLFVADTSAQACGALILLALNTPIEAPGASGGQVIDELQLQSRFCGGPTSKVSYDRSQAIQT